MQRPRARRPEAHGLALGILGPVEASSDGRPILLGAAKQRALLAILVLHANEAVSSERLIEELWGAEPPSTAPKMVQVLVSRLRRVLEPVVGAPVSIVTRPLGYALVATPDQIDLGRFEAAVAVARRVAPTDPGSAADELRVALDIWRGAPLSDVAREPFAAWAIPRLEELRLGVIEERVDLDLRAGRQAEVVAELRDLAARHPFRERFAGHLMLALYRTGRQADALEAYHAIRVRLADELGIEPGPDLQRLQGAMLRQDSSLDMAGTTTPITPSEAFDVNSEAPRPSRTGSTRSRLIAIGLISVVAAIGLAWAYRRPPIPASGTSGPPPAVAAADSVAILDPTTNELVADIPTGHAPASITATGGDIWVGSSDDHTVTRINQASQVVLHTTGLSAAPTSLTASDGNVWIGNGFNGTLSRILAAYDQLSAPFFPGASVSGLLAMAAGEGSLWVGLSDQTLLQLDESSLQVKLTVPIPDRVLAIALDDNAAWIIQFRDDLVRRVDPTSGVVTAGVPVGGTPAAIAFGAGSAWVATTAPNRVWQVDSVHDQPVVSYPITFSPSAIVAGLDAVWVLDGTHGVLERLDPTGRTLAITIGLGRPVGGMVLAGGDLWLAIR